MRDINRREFLKYSIMFWVSLVASDSFASRFSGDSFDESSASVRVFLGREPTLSTNVRDSKIEYPIVAGSKRNYPTPKGVFSIEKIIYRPNWYPPRSSSWVKNNCKLMAYIKNTDNVDKNGNVFVPYGHEFHPLGEWKIGFYDSYYIHGAGDFAIEMGRRYASHGCIRMRDGDIGDVVSFCKEYSPLIYIS